MGTSFWLGVSWGASMAVLLSVAREFVFQGARWWEWCYLIGVLVAFGWLLVAYRRRLGVGNR